MASTPNIGDERTLGELEAMLLRRVQTYDEINGAVTEIRERHLYRERGYADFRTYWLDYWEPYSAGVGPRVN